MTIAVPSSGAMPVCGKHGDQGFLPPSTSRSDSLCGGRPLGSAHC